jgi:hypothetical protein
MVLIIINFSTANIQKSGYFVHVVGLDRCGLEVVMVVDCEGGEFFGKILW